MKLLFTEVEVANGGYLSSGEVNTTTSHLHFGVNNCYLAYTKTVR